MKLNQEIFNYLFSLSRYPVVANIALLFSYHLVYVAIVVLTVWAALFAPRKVYSLALMFFAGGGAWVSASVLKKIFVIQRPYLTLENILPVIEIPSFSFPSGHAASMAGLAVAVYALNPKWGVILFAMAILTGLSRIVLGVHYPSDVLAGWILGAGVGVLVVFLFNKI
jgi:undecaprenyl-diphosphatase